MSDMKKSQSDEIIKEKDEKAGEVSEISEKESKASLNGESETKKTDETKDGGLTEPFTKSEEEQGAEESIYTKEQTDELLCSYPSVDINELMQDELFVSFCDGKDGSVSLKSRYEQYKRFTEDFEKKSSYRLAAARASVGSLADTSAFEEAYFTKEQVMAMSPEEIRKNYDAIRKSQNNW